MALNLKNDEVELLAAEVAHLTGESKTEAIRQALLERRRRLSQRQVAQTDIVQSLEDSPDPRHVGEQLERRRDRHVEHIGDRLTVKCHCQRLSRVASAAAYIPIDCRPITGEKTTLPVLAQSTSHHHQRWLKVMLPGRPNSSTGWIKRAGTQKRFTSWFIHVGLAARRVWVYHNGVGLVL